ncbi:hypothetical protein MMC15_007981 [Xylographa vitiligo]|nr:hypothetical protein [Xylographa vitiligo]
MSRRQSPSLVKRVLTWFGQRVQGSELSLTANEVEAGLELLSEEGVWRVQNKFLQIIRNGGSTHSSTRTPAPDPYVEWYLTYLDTKLQSFGSTLKSVLHNNNSITNEVEIAATVKFYQVLAFVAIQLTSTEVSPTMKELRDSALLQYFRHCHDENAVLQILFIAIGFLTMLYEPELEPTQNTIEILRPKHVCGLPIATETITKYVHGLASVSDLQTHQLLNSFGRFIPGSPAWVQETLSPFKPDVFTEQVVVSYLNFYTLTKVAKIQIVFVDSLGLHLELDEKEKILKLKGLPTQDYVSFPPLR